MKANVQVKAAKTVIAGLVLRISSLVQVVLLDPTAGQTKVLLDLSTLTHTVLPVEAVGTSEAVATVEAVAAATVEALLVALVMDSGRTVFISQAHRT